MYAAVVAILYIYTKLLHSELFARDMVNQKRRKYYCHHKEGQILNGVFCWDLILDIYSLGFWNQGYQCVVTLVTG